MGLNIVALFIFIFGAYAYGYLLLLWLRRPPPDLSRAQDSFNGKVGRVGQAMFAACTLWFVLNAIIEFRFLLGDSRENDLIDLAALELVFFFPGLIFHTYYVETAARLGGRAAAGWRAVQWALYGAGAAMAVYFTGVIYDVIPGPRVLGPYVGISIGALFTVMSACCLVLMRGDAERPPTSDQRRLRVAMKGLFLTMIAVFIALNVLRDFGLLIRALDVGVRMTPLAFLLVSVYFENRIEFYDLVIKRGVLLLLSLVLTGGVLALALGVLDAMPDGATRPWILAVLLLPVAMLMPWLHDRVGRLLDRLWFGREFTPVEAVKHVLGAMQQAPDEPSLLAATEAALTDIFRRRVRILRDGHSGTGPGAVVVDVRSASGDAPVRLAVLDEAGTPHMLSEDVALLRSLGGVFSYMLENVRLQGRRQEQEQVAQALRLQSSRSELKALRAQINPHFLFNALNAIASLIHTDPARADAAVEQLAEVFRYTLRRSEQEWAPLDQELAFARAYLDVEQARFGKRLAFEIHADDEAARAHVPAMLLQTLVENAVKHGISPLRRPGRIDVQASVSNRRVVLEVRDTGPGIGAAGGTESTGESFGLRSVRDRLHGHFGESASLELRRDGDLTIARIELPLVEVHAPPVHGSPVAR
ncbi:MAG TPA: histidine kinase [Vicinamibacterales bacterium]|nr:histidine kinase [Vicinamibacterales bacterium]